MSPHLSKEYITEKKPQGVQTWGRRYGEQKTQYYDSSDLLIGLKITLGLSICHRRPRATPMTLISDKDLP
jgi:hypothetical protein